MKLQNTLIIHFLNIQCPKISLIPKDLQNIYVTIDEMYVSQKTVWTQHLSQKLFSLHKSNINQMLRQRKNSLRNEYPVI